MSTKQEQIKAQSEETKAESPVGPNGIRNLMDRLAVLGFELEEQFLKNASDEEKSAFKLKYLVAILAMGNVGLAALPEDKAEKIEAAADVITQVSMLEIAMRGAGAGCGDPNCKSCGGNAVLIIDDTEGPVENTPGFDANGSEPETAADTTQG